ncbi:VOC family protein [Mycobacterium kansasii]
MIRRLSLFYAAADIERARALFTAALAVEFTEERNLGHTTYFAANLPDKASLELWPASGRPPTRVQLEFVVADLDAAAERLSAAGFEVRCTSAAVLVVDPNGNTVALTAP